MAYNKSLVDRLLRESREIVLAELRDLFDTNRPTGYGPLYDTSPTTRSARERVFDLRFCSHRHGRRAAERAKRA